MTPTIPPSPTVGATLTVPDGPKMLRETLCVAQAAVGRATGTGDRDHEHIDRIQRLIDEIDRHRPLGSDGKHGYLHTATCGCDDVMGPTVGDVITTAGELDGLREAVAVALVNARRARSGLGPAWQVTSLAGVDSGDRTAANEDADAVLAVVAKHQDATLPVGPTRESEAEHAAMCDREEAHERLVRAEAWAEGFEVGWEHCQDGNFGTDAKDDDTPNPYRTTETQR